MSDEKLTPLMQDILFVLAEFRESGRKGDYPATPNAIGYKLGLAPVHSRGMGTGRGRGHRVFGPAQRIIFPLLALERRGRIVWTQRPDGRSGRAVALAKDENLNRRRTDGERS